MRKRLFYDIETSFNVGVFWRTGYNITINHNHPLHLYTEKCRKVQKGTEQCRKVQKAERYRKVQKCTERYRNVQKSAEMCRNVQKCKIGRAHV